MTPNHFKIALCVLFSLLSSGGFAMTSEGDGPEVCTTELVAQLKEKKAPILEILPQLKLQMHEVLELALRKPIPVEALLSQIAAIEKLVVDAGWSPPQLEEDYFTPEHAAVRDAAHDLKNAMQVCLIQANELHKAGAESEREIIAKGIATNLRHAYEITGQMENPLLSPKRVISLLVLFQDLEKLLASLPSKYKLIFEKPAPGFAVYASRIDILRMVQNLAYNAVQAMPDGGTIELSVGVGIPGQYGPTEHLIIRIADNGPGMDPDKVTNPPPPAGTVILASGEEKNRRGIGLTSVLTLAEKNGGAVDVNSEIGKGTVFQLFFPRINRQMNAEIEAESQVTAVPHSILIADDSKDTRDMFAMVFEIFGVPSVKVGHSLSLLEAFRRNKANIRAVFLDQNLGDGSSIEENVNGLRAEGCTVPIIVVSGYDRVEGVKVDALIIKPVGDMQVVLDLLNRLAPLPAK